MSVIPFSEINPDIKLVYRIHLDEADNITCTKRFMTDRIIIFSDGDCDFHFSNLTIRPKTGTVVYIPAMEPYTTCFHGSQELVQICFCFTPESFSRGYYSTPFDLQKPTAILPADRPVLPDSSLFRSPFSTAEIPDIQERAIHFYQEFSNHPIGYELRIKAMLLDLLVSMYRVMYPQSQSSMVASEILAYISKHCEEKLNRDNLCSHFHYHPAHINRLIRQYTGMTTHRYILYARIQRAQSLLSLTDMSITDIAHKLSFYDSSHFASIFQKETGILPNEYRKMSKFV